MQWNISYIRIGNLNHWHVLFPPPLSLSLYTVRGMGTVISGPGAFRLGDPPHIHIPAFHVYFRLWVGWVEVVLAGGLKVGGGEGYFMLRNGVKVRKEPSFRDAGRKRKREKERK